MPSAPFRHRACYVNFGEHLQNHWNVNLLWPGAPNEWSPDDWRRFLTFVKACGYSTFEYWLVPTLYDRPALEGGAIQRAFAATMRQVNRIAHDLGLTVECLAVPNTIGPDWYSACPHLPDDKQLIRGLWRHWVEQLEGTDLFGIFPGDPGGCNRNGCDHETYIDLALELTELTRSIQPTARIDLGTWGTPFTGWGDDARRIPGWDGSWDMLVDPQYARPGDFAHIWNGTPERAKAAMDYLIGRLPDFPNDTLVSINLGFSPDGHATQGGDARGYARAVSEIRTAITWDYSASEGELVCYPHWRLPRLSARRREERTVGYSGGISYTMTPKLNLLTLWCSGQMYLNPDADPDRLSREFCTRVFGAEHAGLGELFEAFEVVAGWGHYPRRQWSKGVLRSVYAEIVERLEAADVSGCDLPLFPEPEEHRQDLLWFARRFLGMAGEAPDRGRIRDDYWRKALAIYDHIPMSADERAEASAERFSAILR
ncbi:MAG: hypothetical protein HYU66_02825 [Armatimonadetes bacterium]|nr:hypothetical protein [Armatimonadota bacterium]